MVHRLGRKALARLATALLLALATGLSFPRTAGAQGPAAEARDAFRAGLRALDEGRYRDAIDTLERSRQLRDVAVVNFNLGLAYRGVGRNLDAIAAFERYLAHPDPHDPPGEIQAVRAAVSELRATLATLLVRVEPFSATVTLDGRALALTGGAATVDPGAHVLEASADGYRLERRELDLARGARTAVALALAPSNGPARLVVVPSVAGAVVTIDGERQPTSIVSRALPPGEHAVSIRAPGYEVFQRTVTLGRTGQVRVEARLARVAPFPWAVPVGIAAGVVVVGGIVGGVILATQPRQGDLSHLHPTLGTWNE